MASITYVGHSSFLIDFGGITVLTDPWMDPKPLSTQRLVAPSMTADKIKKLDAIFVSHFAPDHCDAYDITTLVNRTFASVIAPEEALANLQIADRYKVAAVVGDKFHLYGIDIEVMDTRNPKGDQAVSYQIKANGKTVYFAGDSYDFYGFSKVEADVGIVPIGGAYTMDILGAVSAVKKMKVHKVIPCHFNTFERIKADPHDFAKRVEKEAKAIPVVLSVGQTMDF